jgi:thiopeptide-type bacteriocin biosynthesis protein
LLVHILDRFVFRAPLLPVAALQERAPFGSERNRAPLTVLALAVARPAPSALAHYARRAAFRATPQALWAGIGVGELGERSRARTGPMRAAVTVAYERLWRDARARLDQPAARAAARLRVAPSLVRDETAALWLAFGDGEATEAVERAAEVDELLAAILDGAADWIAWQTLCDQAGADDELLLTLIDDGLLVHDGAPPLVGLPPLAWMAARHENWAEVADALAMPTPAAIEAAHAAELPLHAVLVHEGAVTLSRTAVERAATLAPLLFRLQEALAPPLAERALPGGGAAALHAAAEVFGAGAFELGALALGHYGTALGADDDDGNGAAVPAPLPAVQRALVDAILGAVAAGETVVALDAVALDALAPPAATPPSFELMLTPMRERPRAAPGDGWLLGLHAPAGASWGRFAHAVGAPLAVALQALADAEPAATADLAYAPSLHLGDLTAHPPLRAATLALSSWPEANPLTPATLELAVDPATAGPWLQVDGMPLVPSPLWRVRSTTAPRGLYRLLTGLALTRQHAPWALHLGALADLAWLPRLTLDGFVVAPASWRLPPLPDRAALSRWRRQLRVPDAIQVGHEDQLLLVRLDDRDAVATLARLAADGARAWEVWPPLDAGIDAGGRRLEAIVAVVDDEAAPPPALAPVPPPRATGPAPGWVTYKLFGAADRADRVLGGVVAPLIDQLRPALVDGWFFLRYVDGPGRRDHLRLRLRTGQVAAVEAALAAALDPARAAGDVVAVERAEYFPEHARYGADAMDAVERVFQSDSELVLGLLGGDEDDGDLEALLVSAYDALATGAGLEPAARLELARRRRAAYGIGRDEALATRFRAVSRPLRSRLARPSPPFVAHAERVAAALGELAPARRAELLPPLLHLTAVRLGGPDGAAREAAAFYLWERARESLARHAER